MPTTTFPLRLRRMRQTDLPEVLRVQAECYEHHTLESEQTIRARLAIAPNSAWVCTETVGISAYLVAYPSRLGRVTPLGGRFIPAAEANCLYLHDLAVGRAGKGCGLGPTLVEHALSSARQQGIPYSSLVSVQGSRGFWEKMGFEPYRDLAPEQVDHLNTYPGEVWYMVKPLACG